MTKGIIYYTDNRVEEPIFSLVQEWLKKPGLPITSVSLKPIEFGNNLCLHGLKRSYPTMLKQIITALENSQEDVVFFCENDVLYHPSHFDFTPPESSGLTFEQDIFYYDKNVWRWRLWDNKAITYDGMLPLSSLCVNRKFALFHYRQRLKTMNEWRLDEIRSREPRWARRWGYEPGTKPKRRGGFSDDEYKTWSSEFPSIDIRHKRTFSSPKCTYDSFRYPPTGWKEIPIEEIPGWNLKELFKL